MNEPKPLPKGWTHTTIEELKLFAVGGDWGQNPTEEVSGHKLTKVIRATEFRNWREEKGKTAVNRLIKGSSLLTRRLHLHDFVVEVSGGGPTQPVGRTILIDEAALKLANAPLICSNFCRLLRLSPEVWPPYIKYFLDSVYKSGIMDGFQTQTTNLRNLNFDRFLQGVKVPLAPLEEQKRIALKLDTLFSELDAGLSAIERARAKVKSFRASLLRSATAGELSAQWRVENPATETGTALLTRIGEERRERWEATQRAKRNAKSGAKLFEDESWKKLYVAPKAPDTSNMPELPDSWCWASVEQLGEVQGGIQKQPKRAPQQNAFPYLRVANVLRDRLDLSQMERMELFNGELDHLRLEKDDILIVEGNGSQKEIGRSALWNEAIPDCVHQNHIIRLRITGSSPSYVNIYWNSPNGRDSITAVSASTSGLYTLSVAKVKAIIVPLPPLAEQEWIVGEVERRLSLVSEAEATLDAAQKRAQSLKAAILARAFRGELSEQDPRDESADELLKRIRAARNDAPKRGGRAKSEQGRLF